MIFALMQKGKTMKLIDVDAFTKDNAWKWEGSGGSEDYYYSAEYLTKRHSVEAIPVDWIIEWEKKEENYYRYKDMVRLMIDDWRKEHETD